MKKPINTFIMLGLISGLLTTSHADTIKTAMKLEKGTFQEYKKGKFIFKTEKGRQLEISRSSVRTLTLDEPRNASFRLKGKSKTESAELLGYDKLKFSFAQKKKKLNISAMNVISVRAHATSSAGEGGVVSDGNNYIKAIDVSGLEGAEMTDAQRSTLTKYNTVRKGYDAFLSTSTALVKKLENLTGGSRDKVLVELRNRKNQEQPLRIQMSAAHKALLAAFPDPIPAKPVKKEDAIRIPIAPPPGESAAEVIDDTIDEASGEVLLIDTSSLASSPGLSEKQKNSLKAYDDAVKAYQQVSAQQIAMANAVNAGSDADKGQLMLIFEKGKKEARAARTAVLRKQAAFLKAFPELQLTE
jgi:hypothetical protein